jgi:hypothetical protein
MKFQNLFWVTMCIFSFLSNNLFSRGPGKLPARSVDFNAAHSGLRAIAAENLLPIVAELSHPKYRGRQAGTQGYRDAAQFVAAEFEKFGLKPAVSGSYFQELEVETNEIRDPLKLVLHLPDGQKIAYQPGRDFICRGFSGAGQIQAPVVFCGYGISAPENGYNDYAEIEVRNKIVAVFKPEPGWKPETSAWSQFSFPRKKAETAVAHGALGMIMLSTPNSGWQQVPIGSVYHGAGIQQAHFPQIHAGNEVARDLFKTSGRTLAEIQTQIDSTSRPFSFPLDVIAEMEVTAEFTPRAKTMNVIGLLEGSDPELKQEVVLITAHLDHVGNQGDSVFFPGANDDASGVAALIRTAAAFHQNPVKPKRSVLFIAYSAEEMGLDGSRFYAANPVAPLEKTVAQLNADCIGIGDSIQVNGGKDFPELHALAAAANHPFIDRKNKASGSGGGADAQPLYEKGVPTLYFVTTNGYAHLHLPSDHVETLDPRLFEAATQLLYLTAWGVTQTSRYFNHRKLP